ncbi:hypothetical protein PVK62_07765 [Aliivibrio sp. S3MY1]|uniref:Uncharacterized protein n=1 Tax=Aliivibrio wodanis TaxID=80852 RepID=A0A5Q4ZYY6_9GAMM|nr:MULTISPECIES: hypothetical protein [Aliivibrio]MDD9195734.1 hypothetical protein [Aliivibrio sp. S3MY1]VVV07075.1 hypothetical protein AW0309160_04569 [Aliivibrio wodanis]
MAFDIDGLFYNADRRSEEPPSEGVIPDDLFPFMFFLVSPIMFFIGSIYTAYKKDWVWFGALVGDISLQC